MKQHLCERVHMTDIYLIGTILFSINVGFYMASARKDGSCLDRCMWTMATVLSTICASICFWKKRENAHRCRFPR